MHNDNSDVYKLLEELQLEHINKYSYDTESTAEKLLSNQFEHHFDIKLPTPYQNYLHYYLMKEIIDDLDGCIDELPNSEIYRNKKGNFPAWGTVNNIFIGAHIYRVASGATLIVLSDAMFFYSSTISKIFSDIITLSEDGKRIFLNKAKKSIMVDLSMNCLTQQEFNNLIGSMTIYHAPWPVRPIIPQNLKSYWTLCHTFETFIVAHEYSHFLLGHLDSEKAPIVNTQHKTNFDLGDLMPTQYLELEADKLGAELTMIAMRKKGFNDSLSALAILIGFMGLRNIERIEECFYKITADRTASHPLTNIRKANILETILKDDVIDLYYSLEEISDFMWDVFLIKFKKIVKNVLSVFGTSLSEVPPKTIEPLYYN